MHRSTGWMLIAFLFAAAAAVGSGASGPGAAVDRYFEGYRSMDPDQVAAAYSPEAVFVDVAQREEVSGAEAIKEMVARLVALHLEMGIKEKRRVVSGNQVAVEFAFTGTISGAAMRQASGKTTCQDTTYEVPATSWFEVSDGRIIRQTDFIDLATLEEVKKRASGQTP